MAKITWLYTCTGASQNGLILIDSKKGDPKDRKVSETRAIDTQDTNHLREFNFSATMPNLRYATFIVKGLSLELVELFPGPSCSTSDVTISSTSLHTIKHTVFMSTCSCLWSSHLLSYNSIKDWIVFLNPV